MADIRKPRKGSMAYWPRKRSKKLYPRIKGWSALKNSGKTILAFPGYKAGMTHVIGTDNRKTAHTKGEDISVPVTIIECPPIKILCARFYKQTPHGLTVSRDIMFKPSKEMQRKLKLPNKLNETSEQIKELDKLKPEEFDDISIIVYTMPSRAGVDKKKPELFETKLGGSAQDKLSFIKEHADKEIKAEDVFKEEEFVDVHAVTKGRGTQGPVRRFGIGLKSHKAEKGRRQPGSRGPWISQQHIMYRTAYAGQTGCQQRMQYNLQLFKLGSDPEEVNPEDGFPHYGKLRTSYALLKGSVPGAKKRMIIMTPGTRPHRERPVPSIQKISLQSKQGR